ncbi:hypothetical protein SAMN02745753_02214 [Marinomonas polaris DSM 16579]|uniref:Uncharacterized protein n=1 Tax=Marinomonas polaris DSM 16579 TaxID=1122206 RepID=A0A1M5CQM7_9GAMM|nr:hypothetical protein SAMN02745753_02214 [Marinomonas polaris DSM 16579]
MMSCTVVNSHVKKRLNRTLKPCAIFTKTERPQKCRPILPPLNAALG